MTTTTHPDGTIDVEAIRANARASLEKGALTSDYSADLQQVLHYLDGALATELVCHLRYTHHALLAEGLQSPGVAQEFREHASQEQDHARRIAERIVQLGGHPDHSPARLLERSHADYVEADSLKKMLEENLVAERIAIESYRAGIRMLGDDDPTTRRLLEEILEVEEEHADDLAGLLRKGGARA